MPFYISREENVDAYPDNEFMAFYQSRVTTGICKHPNTIDSFYGYVINERATKCVVICQGRSESLIKYAEVVFELYQNGYSVFMFDHQGQGQSSRLLKNRHIGYVKSFDDYVVDMHELIKNILTPILSKYKQDNLPKSLLCHSMGGAIGTLYVQKHPTVFTQLVMTAPMIGVLTPISEQATQSLFKTVNAARELFGLCDTYLWGQGNYLAHPFAKNQLTNCEVRYRVFREMMTSYPQNQLGGISVTWLIQAIAAMVKLRLGAADMSLPILVFQAEQEQIVDNHKMNQFVEKLPNCEFIKVANAKHELLFEKDSVRVAVVTKILEFLSDTNFS